MEHVLFMRFKVANSQRIKGFTCGILMLFWINLKRKKSNTYSWITLASLCTGWFCSPFLWFFDQIIEYSVCASIFKHPKLYLLKCQSYLKSSMHGIILMSTSSE